MRTLFLFRGVNAGGRNKVRGCHGSPFQIGLIWNYLTIWNYLIWVSPVGAP